MAYELIAHSAFGLIDYWLRAHIQARGIIVNNNNNINNNDDDDDDDDDVT